MQIKGLSNLNIDMAEKDIAKVIRVFNSYQLDVKKTIDEVIKKQILNGILHKDIEVTLGTSLSFEHKLGRVPLGYIAVDNSDDIRIDLLRVNNDNKGTLVLTPMFYTDWIEYTPTLANFTLSGDDWLYRIVGNSIDIRTKGQVTGTVATKFTASIPSILNIDYSRMPSYNGFIICGNCQCWDNSAGINYHGLVETLSGSDSFQFTGHSCAAWTSLIPVVWQLGADEFALNVTNLPVSGLTKKVDIWVF